MYNILNTNNFPPLVYARIGAIYNKWVKVSVLILYKKNILLHSVLKI